MHETTHGNDVMLKGRMIITKIIWQRELSEMQMFLL
jgi:hypothetical protein